jgi:fatty-acyl-CoA synthase
MTPRTIPQALLDAAATDRSGIVFLRDDDRAERLGHAELVARALRVAAMLRRDGVTAGARVPVALPTGPALIATFYGAMLAGAIPCLLSTPSGFGSTEAFDERFVAICRYVDARHAVVTRDVVARLGARLPATVFVDDVALASAAEDPAADQHAVTLPRPDDVAFLQCTSGSTAAPKGVMVSHANLSANAAQMASALGLGAADVMVSWLPLHHDMGLIGAVLLPLLVGFDTVVMASSRFLRRPVSWLRAISDRGGTVSPAPNFGYGHALARVRDDELARLDLSSWRWAMCGAEPIDCGTLRRFAERFAAAGLAPTAIQPCYGLAEASLAVTIHRGAPFSHDAVDREALAAGRTVAASEPAAATELANCGAPLEGTRIRIVDAAGRAVPDGQIGRIEVAGPSVMLGYYNLPEATAARLRDGWLDTGDLGYLRDGELRITGRAQDVIIIRGKNYDPTDFERAAEQVEGVRRSVGFGVLSAVHARDLLYVVCETERIAAALVDDLCRRIADTVAARTGLRPDRVVVTPLRRAIARTTSGKLQRNTTKQLVLSGQLGTPWKAAS